MAAEKDYSCVETCFRMQADLYKGLVTDDQWQEWYKQHCEGCEYEGEICMYGEDFMIPIHIKRALNENTRKQGILIGRTVYALHITKNREVIITDNRDYSLIYAVMSLDFYNRQADGEG